MTTKSTKYPTFSSKGWITSPLEKLDFLLSHAFIAEDRQTNEDNDFFISFHELLSGLIDEDMSKGMSKLEEKLTIYLNKYYDSVECNVYNRSEEINDPSSGVTVVIDFSVVQDGVLYTTKKLLNTSNGIFNSLLNISNTGNV